jgi:hypothetical protein
MKKSLKLLACLLIPILFISCTNKNIITNPITGEKVLVAKKDLGQMNWDDAQNRCKELGEGWRLPTYEELEIMCINYKRLEMPFKNTYFSSTFNIYDNDKLVIKGLIFTNCSYYYINNRYNTYFVRPVKTIK